MPFSLTSFVTNQKPFKNNFSFLVKGRESEGPQTTVSAEDRSILGKDQAYHKECKKHM